MKNRSNRVAATVASGLRKVLQIEANTTSSMFSFQPKAPADLKRFRSTK